MDDVARPIADAAAAADGASPLDEAARMALADGAADGRSSRATTASRCVHDGDLSAGGAPDDRAAAGVGTALLGGVEASYAGELTALVARQPPGRGAARGGARLGPGPRPLGDAARRRR